VNERTIASWDEFDPLLHEIEEQYGPFHSRNNLVLFRGQSNSSWELKTTLERYADKKWTAVEYLKFTRDCLSKLETLSGIKWNLPDERKAIENIQNSTIFKLQIPHEDYEYWTYLRHNGFPSPLLDWSASPYIAALFAFNEPFSNRTESFASIFIYIEKPEGGKAVTGGRSRIEVKGPYARSHPRHYLQQAHYTLSSQKTREGHCFTPHEEVFALEEQSDGITLQDILIKVIIPCSERKKVLEYLQKRNINLYSLMQTEEALVKSVAYQELELM